MGWIERAAQNSNFFAGKGRERKVRHLKAYAIFFSMKREATFMTGSGNGKDDDAEIIGALPAMAVKTRPKTKKPSQYKVYLLNDDYTPMEFVVHILEKYFNKNHEDAVRIMLHVHRHGAGLCGVYTREVAETKVSQVLAAARRAQHPLQCTMEKE